MKRLTTLLLVFIFIFFCNLGYSQSWAEKMASTVMSTWKDSMTMQPGRPVRWAYDQGVVLKGIEGLWYNTADKKYFDYIQQSMDHFVENDGSIRTYNATDYNID